MSDGFDVNPEHRNIGPLNEHEKHTVRPALITYCVGALVFLAAVLLSNLAPELFSSLGGWVTAIIIVAIAALVGTYTMVQRMNRRSSMPDETLDRRQD
ncbi:hypothetical protein [Promicromonospora sp. NPDC023987]|uniref:hypothetical protein n=1 Tax=Promicromonospora sp. NPDC023987 TaxID=3155360 RepID=UPI0033D842F8